MHDALHTGAAALQHLLDEIRTIGDAASFEDDTDDRDYHAIVSALESSLLKHVIQTDDKKHREGYLRALGDLLSIAGDGGLPYFDEWDPISNTARAYGELPAGDSHA